MDSEGFEPGFLLPNESLSFHRLHGLLWITTSYMDSGLLLSLISRSCLMAMTWGFDTV